jgi:hypothetical protein
MRPSFHRSILAVLGLSMVGLGCKSASGEACTPFPRPVTTSCAACTPLPGLTVLRDLGTSEPCGGYGSQCMVVDDTAIYFTASDGAPTPTLFRMPKTGGSPQVVEGDVGAPISIDGASLVFTRMTSHPQSGGVAFDYPNVVRLDGECSSESLPSDGWSEAQQAMVDSAGGITWLASSASTSSMAFLHWDPATNQTRQILTPSFVPSSFAVHGEALYWLDGSNGTGQAKIVTMPSSGGAERTIATIPGAVAITDVDDDALYVLTVPAPGPSAFTLLRVSAADGSTTTVAADLPGTGEGTYVGYVVHDTNVYWAEGGRVLRAPKSGGNSDVVLDLGGASQIETLAFDACNVYVAGSTGAGYAVVGEGLPSAAAAAPGNSSADAGGVATFGDASVLIVGR